MQIAGELVCLYRLLHIGAVIDHTFSTSDSAPMKQHTAKSLSFEGSILEVSGRQMVACFIALDLEKLTLHVDIL